MSLWPVCFWVKLEVLSGQADPMHRLRGQKQASVNGRSQETSITERDSVLTVHLGARFCPPGLH